MSGGVGAGRLDEDEDSVAAVVVNGDVALVLNGLRQSGLMGRNEMWRGEGCVYARWCLDFVLLSQLNKWSHL